LFSVANIGKNPRQNTISSEIIARNEKNKRNVKYIPFEKSPYAGLGLFLKQK